MTPGDREKLLKRYRVTDGDHFRLKDFDPADPGDHVVEHGEAAELLRQGVERLSELQARLYAQQCWSQLVVFQAMDAAGKDGTIRHVFTGVNPEGVEVTSFKQPGPEELAHDFLWRVHAHVPARGRIGIFNRSHYEEVLVCRVHPELLDRQNLPEPCRDGKFWRHRLKDISAWEKYLARQGIVIQKFFLNISKEEQKRRFIARLDEPHKNWKFSVADLAERAFWDDYMHAYQEAIAATAAPHAPWYVVPADRKWFTHLVVVEAIVDALERLELKEPAPSAEEAARLQAARMRLESEE
jgi:PPK2 family polyphosphate:nucleotide phosphotransferase